MTTAGLYFVRFLLSAMVAALPARPAASTQNGEVHLNVDELIGVLGTLVLEILTSILAPFSWSMAGWSTRTSMSAQRPVRRAMFAISSRKKLCLAERACPARACRRVFAFLVEGQLRTRFRHASCFCTDCRGRTQVCITAIWPHAGKQSCARSECWRLGSWRNPEAPGPLALSRATRCLLLAPIVVAQVSGGFVDTGECEGALRGCCGSESCQVVGVFTSFSPDGLELGQG